MIRSYALVIMNKQDEIIDRYPLELVTNPTGNGFKLKISTISSDIEDIITKVVQEKLKINMVVNHVNNAYGKANSLASWIQKYSTIESAMYLEYNDGNIIRLCGGKVTSLDKTEKDTFGTLAQNLEFTMTTPFFIKKENNIIFQLSTEGKRYPYKYPYVYGEQKIENNNIDNPYILETPIIVTIYGAITNPTIKLLDEFNNAYNEVSFGTFEEPIIINKEQKLVINSAQKKIYKILEDGTEIDFKPEVNPMYDTYLLAKRGNSIISINQNDTAEGFKLIGSWRQYIL